MLEMIDPEAYLGPVSCMMLSHISIIKKMSPFFTSPNLNSILALIPLNSPMWGSIPALGISNDLSKKKNTAQLVKWSIGQQPQIGIPTDHHKDSSVHSGGYFNESMWNNELEWFFIDLPTYVSIRWWRESPNRFILSSWMYCFHVW